MFFFMEQIKNLLEPKLNRGTWARISSTFFIEMTDLHKITAKNPVLTRINVSKR